MPAGVMLEIPSEVCVPPSPVSSDPWPKAPTLNWDLDMVHAAWEEFEERSLDLKAPPCLSPGQMGLSPACPATAAPWPCRTEFAGTAVLTWQDRLQEPLPSQLHSVFAWTQDEKFLLSGSLWHFVLLFSLFLQSLLLVGLAGQAEG